MPDLTRTSSSACRWLFRPTRITPPFTPRASSTLRPSIWSSSPYGRISSLPRILRLTRRSSTAQRSPYSPPMPTNQLDLLTPPVPFTSAPSSLTSSSPLLSAHPLSIATSAPSPAGPRPKSPPKSASSRKPAASPPSSPTPSAPSPKTHTSSLPMPGFSTWPSSPVAA